MLLDTGTVIFRATDNAPGAGAASTGSRTVHVSRPPDIVFDMHDTLTDTLRAGNRNIYRVALDGRDLVRLTSGDGDNIGPAPSAHGSPIVFTTFREGSAKLYSVQADGTLEAPIAELPSGASFADFASDGSTLAFIAPSGGTSGLWTALVDGSDAALVPGAPPGAILANPTWCKGGDSIVVVTTALSNAALFIESASTGLGRALTNGTTYDVDPACAFDAATVAFASSRDGDVGLFAASGTPGAESVHRLDVAPANDGQPAWLPDGRLVFVSAVGTDSAHLAWLDPAIGSTATRIPLGGSGSPAHPKFAPPVVAH
jgi:Tol biopolymer transport system component